MSFIQIIYDRYCSILTISTILFRCRSMSVSFLRVGVSVAVVVSWCLQSLFPWLWFVLSRNWACQRYVFNFIKGFGIYIWVFFSSNRYAKGTFNLPPLPLTPPPTPTPPHPPPQKKKKKNRFLSVITFCILMAAMIHRWLKIGKLQAGQRMLHLIGQNLPTTFGESLIWNSVSNDILLQAA